jgi:hypothetical protein
VFESNEWNASEFLIGFLDGSLSVYYRMSSSNLNANANNAIENARKSTALPEYSDWTSRLQVVRVLVALAVRLRLVGTVDWP